MFEGPGGRRSSLPTSTSGSSSSGSLQETGSKVKRECFTFEPQQWRKSVCKNCFRTQPEHPSRVGGSNGAGDSSQLGTEIAPTGTTSAPNEPPVKTPTWASNPVARKTEQTAPLPGRTRMATPQYTPANIPTKENKTPSPREDRLSNPGGPPTVPSAGSRAMSRKAPAVSQRSVEDPRGFVGQRSAPTPAAGGASPQLITSASGTGVYSSASSIDARYVEELENDFFDLEDKYDSLLRERNELSVELDAKMRNIEELQTLVEQYKEKATTLGVRCTHLEEEIKTYRERLRLPESDQVEVGDLGPSKTAPTLGALEGDGGGDLRQRLNEVEQLCQDVMEENEVLKEELEEMQREIEEMHDHFQEEDRDSMREMQRDLDTANKTVRIFQFKLRKAERRLEQCENERANLEERLSRLESELYSETDVAHIRNLEDELRVAKEVGVRLNNELDALEEKRHFYENENQQLKDELQVCQNRRITSENELDRLRLELEKVKAETGFSERGPLQVTDKKASRAVASTCPSLSREPSVEEHELQRELQSTKEREADLSEQLRFAEEEIRKLTRRITEAQAESDVLSRQVERLNAAQGSGSRGSSPRSSTPFAKKGPEFQAPVQSSLKEQQGAESELLERRCASDQEAVGGSGSHSSKNEEEIKAKQEQLTESLKRLNQLSRDLIVLSSESKSHEWFSKYKDAMERLKDYESQVGHLRKKLLDSPAGSPMPSRQARQTKSSESRSEMNKDALIKELESFEHELDAVDEELAAVKASANALRTQVRTTHDEFSDYRTEAEDRERELRSYVEYMEQKDALSIGILELLLQRTDVLQSEVDRFTKQEGTPAPSIGESEKQAKIENLENLLAETQKKSQLLEKQIKEGLPLIGRPMLSENERKRLREIDLLRGQLEEKDEILEDQEGQLRDMKTRLERAKKMNEAMKTLIDKEPAEQISVGKSVENKQVALEIASYRRELECTRKELAIVQQKLTQMERVREKLLIENKDLQEELKLREDSLFDQDDELEKRNAELVKLKRTFEQMKSELEESKTELSRIKTQESGSFSSKLAAVIADNEKLREELSAKVRGLGEISAKLAALESREKETSGRCERLSKELSVKESDLRERDVLLLEAKKEARKLADELGSVRKQDGETQQRVQQLEKTVNELNQKLQERESETTHLQPTVASVEASPGLSRSPGWRTDSSPDSGIFVSDIGGGRGSRDNTLSRRAELDRLRREVGQLREERDELARKARKDRQEFERRLAEVSGGRKSSFGGNSVPGVSSVPAGPSTAAGTGDLYSRAIAERQMTTKLSLLNEHTTRQNRVIMEMKIQNESLQNKMLEYQRRYVNLKEQYDAEQDAWLSERVILESKAKEMRLPPVEATEKSTQQEDRKGVIMSTRKSLQEACIKLAEAEKEYERERQRLASEIERLENERAELKVQLAHLKDQQKMPKVLQRFGGSSSRSGQLPQLSASVTSAANSEAARRLEAAERTISKLRSELQSKTDNFSHMSTAAVKEAEAARQAAEQQMETMKEQVVQLVFYREQADLFRERLIEAERVAEREYKVWSDEREDLLYRIEDARISVEQWCLRLHHRENNELQTSDELVDEVVAEMERWRSSKLKAVAVPRRASVDSSASDGFLSPSMTESQTTGEVPTTPVTPSRGFGTLASNQRSTSMEWFNRAGSSGAHGQRGSTLSLAATFGMSPSLLRSSGGGQQFNARCGRSVSPDVSIRKVTNYPDPTPGFLIRPSSRQGSIDSLSSIGDATQKPFSVPGKPPLRQPISPARRKFFDETASAAAQQPETPQPPPPPVVESVSKPETQSLPNPTIVSIASEQKTRATSEKSSATPRSSKTKTVKSTPPESGGELRTAGRDKSPSVISRLSSRFTGASGTGKSDSKSPSRKGEADKSKQKPEKPSTEKGPLTKTPETMTTQPPSAPASNEAGLRRHSEAPSMASLQQSKTPEFPSVTLKKTPVSTGIGTTTTTTARSSRSNSTGIAPSIMLLRQKFSGK
ncbi:positive regulation of microtubule motor activity [Sparganum proliferum]